MSRPGPLALLLAVLSGCPWGVRHRGPESLDRTDEVGGFWQHSIFESDDDKLSSESAASWVHWGDDACDCPDGEGAIGADALKSYIQKDLGILRTWRAAQEMCRPGRSVAVFSACREDPSKNGYCCVSHGQFDETSLQHKERAATALKDRVDRARVAFVKRSAAVDRAVEALEEKLDSPPAAVVRSLHNLVMFQWRLLEEKAHDCDENMDDYIMCEGPLRYLVWSSVRSQDLDHSADDIVAAVNCLEGRSHTLVGLVKETAHGAALTTGRSGMRVGRAGLQAVRLLWRHRFMLMAGVVAAQGARPFVAELQKAGVDTMTAEEMGVALQQFVRGAFAGISCSLLKNSLLMTELVHFSTQALLTSLDPVVALMEDRFALTLSGRQHLRRLVDMQRSPGADILVLALSHFLSTFWASFAAGVCAKAVPVPIVGKASKTKPKPWWQQGDGPHKGNNMKKGAGGQNNKGKHMPPSTPSPSPSLTALQGVEALLTNPEWSLGLMTVLVWGFTSFSPPGSGALSAATPSDEEPNACSEKAGGETCVGGDGAIGMCCLGGCEVGLPSDVQPLCNGNISKWTMVDVKDATNSIAQNVSTRINALLDSHGCARVTMLPLATGDAATGTEKAVDWEVASRM